MKSRKQKLNQSKFAKLLGVHRHTVRDWVIDKTIKPAGFYKTGRPYFYPENIPTKTLEEKVLEMSGKLDRILDLLGKRYQTEVGS